MPLDPNIALGFQPPQLQNPLASIAQVQALKNQQQQSQMGGLELQQKQTELQQHQQVIQAFQQSGGDLDKAIATLQSQGNPQAFTLQQNRAAVQKSLEDTRKAHLDNVAHTADMVSRSAQQVLDAKPEVRPIVYQGQKAYLESSGLVPQGQLPAEYTGPDMDSWLQTKVAQGQSLKDRVATLKDQAETGATGALKTQREQETATKQRTDALNTLSAATSPEDFQQKIAGLKSRGVSDDVLKEFSGQTWTPELGQQLQTQALTPEQRTTAPKTAAETEAAQVKNAALSLAQAASRSPAEYQSLLAQQPPAVQKRFAALGASPKFNDVLQVGMTPSEAQTAAHEKFMEGQEAIRTGLDQKRLANETAYTPTAPGAANLTGEAFLKTLPPAEANMVRQIADGDRRPPPPGARSAIAQNLNAAVSQYDPHFNGNRFDTMVSFSTGAKSKSVNAVNTAITHLELLRDAGHAMHNGTFVPGNALYNAFASEFGSADPSNFDNIAQRVSGELNKATGSNSEKEMEAIKKNLNRSGSDSQIDGAVRTNIQLLGGAMDSNKQDYMRGTGFTEDHPKVRALLTPRAQQALTAMGVDPNTMKPVAKSGGGVFTVKAPNGKTFSFPTQEKADSFKKAAGIP